MNTWQPFSTAPKDGTLILGLLPKGRDRETIADRLVVISYWTQERCVAEEGGDPEDYDAGWYDEDEFAQAPTHWMQLGEIPS